MRPAGHFDKAEALRCTAEQLAHHLHGLHLAEGLEQIGEFCFVRLGCEITHEYIHCRLLV